MGIIDKPENIYVKYIMILDNFKAQVKNTSKGKR